MTIAHLLDHASGLHNFNGDDGRDFFTALFGDSLRGSRRWRPLELIAFARDPRHRPTGRPGERRSYSSTGYSVLELILEHRGAKPFPLLLREHLFDPLGMTSAGVEGADLTAESIVDSYARPTVADRTRPSPFAGRAAVRDDGLVNLSRGLRHYNAWAGAAGAVAANVGDLAKLMTAIEAGERIVLDDQQRLFAEARLRPDATFAWNGGSWGVQASIIHEPHRDITVIVLTNASNAGADSHDIARQLLLEARK
jgi:D-alanyl-D-alanine carboxypeptidase